MKKFLLVVLLYLHVDMLTAQTSEHIVTSPDKNIVVHCNVDKAVYSISFRGKIVLTDSKLGVVREDEDFSQKLLLIKALPIVRVTDSYSMLTAKKSRISYSANEL